MTQRGHEESEPEDITAALTTLLKLCGWTSEGNGRWYKRGHGLVSSRAAALVAEEREQKLLRVGWRFDGFRWRHCLISDPAPDALAAAQWQIFLDRL